MTSSLTGTRALRCSMRPWHRLLGDGAVHEGSWVDRRGLEPRPLVCRTRMLPLSLAAHGGPPEIRTPTSALRTRCAPLRTRSPGARGNSRGAPGRTRTCNLRLRRAPTYPLIDRSVSSVVPPAGLEPAPTRTSTGCSAAELQGCAMSGPPSRSRTWRAAVRSRGCASGARGQAHDRSGTRGSNQGRPRLQRGALPLSDSGTAPRPAARAGLEPATSPLNRRGFYR